jgi:hypothetical protein
MHRSICRASFIQMLVMIKLRCKEVSQVAEAVTAKTWRSSPVAGRAEALLVLLRTATHLVAVVVMLFALVRI